MCQRRMLEGVLVVCFCSSQAQILLRIIHSYLLEGSVCLCLVPESLTALTIQTIISGNKAPDKAEFFRSSFYTVL